MFLKSFVLGLVLSLPVLAFNESAVCKPASGPVSSLLSFLTPMIKNDDCEDLGKGMFRRQYSRTHLLERDDEGNYRISLRLEFTPRPKAKVSGPEMHERVKKCLAEVSPYLKSPTGETVMIRILGEKETEELPKNQRPRKLKIGIEPEGYRSSSKSYEENVGCSVITHEVLHLLGLYDEYKEQAEELKDKFACRVTTETSSIMNHQEEAFAETIPSSFACNCEGPTCLAIMESKNPELQATYLNETRYPLNGAFAATYCEFPKFKVTEKVEPRLRMQTMEGEKFRLSFDSVFTHPFNPSQIIKQETSVVCACLAQDAHCLTQKKRISDWVSSGRIKTMESCPHGSMTNLTEAGASEGSYSYGSDKILRMRNIPLRTSLLHPNHFKRILAGSCQKKVPDYQACAQSAYQGLDKNFQCSNVKSCQGPLQYLGQSF
jgi:hypothetical protein